MHRNWAAETNESVFQTVWIIPLIHMKMAGMHDSLTIKNVECIIKIIYKISLLTHLVSLAISIEVLKNVPPPGSPTTFRRKTESFM